MVLGPIWKQEGISQKEIAEYCGNGDDFIDGNAGNDTVVGMRGNDELFGSDGDDLIYGDNLTGESLTDGNDIFLLVLFLGSDLVF